MSTHEFDEGGITGEVNRRSLHFFWIVDDSGSMSGENIQAVNYAIKNVLPEIRKIEDQQRINIFMRAIKFGDKATWHVGPDPVSIKQFVWRDMGGDSGLTSTAQAVDLFSQELTLEKLGRRNVPPVAILLSDGYCTDSNESYEQAIAALDKLPWGKKAVRISIGIGQSEDYNKEQLDKFISPYLRLPNGNSNHRPLETLPANTAKKLVKFIKVVSTQASISSGSSKSDLENERNGKLPIDPGPLIDSVNNYDSIEPGDVF